MADLNIQLKAEFNESVIENRVSFAKTRWLQGADHLTRCFALPLNRTGDKVDPEIDRVTARDRSAPKIARLDRPTRLGSVLAT